MTERWEIIGQWLSRSSDGCQADLEIIANQRQDCHQSLSSHKQHVDTQLSSHHSA